MGEETEIANQTVGRFLVAPKRAQNFMVGQLGIIQGANVEALNNGGGKSFLLKNFDAPDEHERNVGGHVCGYTNVYGQEFVIPKSVQLLYMGQLGRAPRLHHLVRGNPSN